MSSTRTADPRRAVVVGGSMAGLLAARALADEVDQVVVLDRDDLPSRPADRGGVPQGRHVHGLLDRGRELLDGWFPGLTADLVARGAVVGDPGLDGVWCFRPEPLARVATGMRMLLVSRPLLEWYVRQRLLQDPRIELRENTSVLDLAFTPDDRRVTGVVAADRDGGQAHVVAGDLVVDASGRSSRTPEWLERRAYAAPPEEVRRVDKRYTTYHVRSAADGSTPAAVAVAARPDVPRSGVLLAQEHGQHVVSLVGRAGVQPPTTWSEFVAFAGSLAAPHLADAIAGLCPVDSGATYRFPANRRRYYERLTRFPQGLVVIGDALCAFDPVYGQGMSVAAVEAATLVRCVADPSPGLAGRFHAAASAVIDNPWTIAVGGTPREDGRVPRPERLIDGYLDRLLRVAATDEVLARAFLRVGHLHEQPGDLLRPRHAVRVARGLIGGTRRVPLPTPAPALAAAVTTGEVR